MTVLFVPPSEGQARLQGLLYEGREHIAIDWREQLDAFVRASDRLLNLLEGVMPEIACIVDAETLTDLHSAVSGRAQSGAGARGAVPSGCASALARSALAGERWDGVVWYSPTIFFGPLVRALKRRCGCRAYLILRDLFPDWAVDAGVMRRGLAYRFFKRVERYQYRRADVIGVQTPANVPLVERTLAGRGARPRIEVLNNWQSASLRRRASVDPEATALAGRTLFAYTGNMGAAQDMDGLLDLAERLRARRDIGFLFVGRGSEAARLRARADADRLDNVLFLDEIDSAEVPALLERCQVGLIALDPRHTTHNIPGKLLTYLRAGLPVLARINPGNDLEALIEREDVGRVCVGDDPERLQRHAEELASDAALRAAMSVRCRALAEREFSSAAAATQVVHGLAA
ncbi:MAG TPA: glycosyltransferase [Dokdonella sp.]